MSGRKRIRSLSLDAKKAVRARFKPSTAAEKRFYSSLRKVAQASGHIVEHHTEGDTVQLAQMQKQLDSYAKALEPWARRQSAKLLESVNKSNKRAYERSSKKMATAVRAEPAAGRISLVAEVLMREQTALITSIPLEAGYRAQKLAMQAVVEGTRAVPDQGVINEIKKQLGLSTEVATSRAKLIAVTETARANASLTQARSLAVGAVGYVWRATMDGATRPSHAKMNGKFVAYDRPPTLSDGTTGHAGTFPNCRCYQDPVFDD